MRKQYIHKVIVFNTKNPHHKQLLDWINKQTTNFSSWGFETLSMRKEGFGIVSSPKPIIQEENVVDDWL